MNWWQLILAGFIGACIGGWFGYLRGRIEAANDLAPVMLAFERKCKEYQARAIQLMQEREQ